VADVLVNTYKNIYVERFGLLQKTNSRFTDDAHLMNIIDRIISRVGRRIDESSPMVDARLPDGSRVNAIIPPLAIDGPILSIRRFSVNPLKMEDLINYKALTPDIAQLLAGCVKAKLNIMISGGTGAGKTTLLNILSAYIPATRGSSPSRIPPNCSCSRSMWSALKPGAKHRGDRPGDSARSGAKQFAHAPRPHRHREVRGAEAFDMLQAMNTATKAP